MNCFMLRKISTNRLQEAVWNSIFKPHYNLIIPINDEKENSFVQKLLVGCAYKLGML